MIVMPALPRVVVVVDNKLELAVGGPCGASFELLDCARGLELALVDGVIIDGSIVVR